MKDEKTLSINLEEQLLLEYLVLQEIERIGKTQKLFKDDAEYKERFEIKLNKAKILASKIENVMI
jgi:hypothetical protein